MAAAGKRRFLITLLSRHYRSTTLLPSIALRISAGIPPRTLQITSLVPAAAHRLDFKSADFRRFCSGRNPKDEESEAESEGSEDGDDDDDEEEDYEEEGGAGSSGSLRPVGESGKTQAEKVEEAAEIGYKVVGPLEQAENPFKPYEPVFAVVQVGSHQFKVSNGDSIFTERLKFCEVNDKLILNKVLMLGSTSQTMIGRPTLPDAAVHAVVEEHALDAKVIIFKKKRRKNYRRTKGHRQELTKLRITNIPGIDKPQNVAVAA